MNKDTEIKLIQTLYDRLYDIVTYSPGGDSKPVFDKKTTLVQLVPLGLPVNPEDFKDMVSPTKVDGNLLASETFAKLVDPIPALQANYAPTTSTVEQVYGSIMLGANIKSKEDDLAAKTKYDNAYKYLNKIVKITDMDGNETESIKPTPTFQAYTQNMSAYLTALSAYRTAYNNIDLTTPEGQKKWQADAPSLQTNMDNAWSTWRSQGAIQVENALAAMDTSINDATALILADDKKRWRNSTMQGQLPDHLPWHLSYALPNNWYDEKAKGFTKMHLATNFLNTSSDSKFTTFKGQTKYTNGLWAVGGSFQHQDKAQHSHTDTNKLEIELELGVVNIIRPWLDGSFLQAKGWYMNNYSKGSISSGDLSTETSKNTMPLLPTSFIVARNIKIKGDWSEADEKHISAATSGKASIGFGPFQLSGQFSTGSSSNSFTSKFENGTIEIPGLQIIAFISQVVPFCPPEE